MATIALMVGGALVNALAFTGSNYLFSKMGKNDDSLEEKKRSDKAMEQLAAATKAYNEKRNSRLDFMNEKLKKENKALSDEDNVEEAMKQYYYITGGDRLPELPPKPKFSDFYTPSEDQKNREIAFVVVGMSLTGLVAWKLNKV